MTHHHQCLISLSSIGNKLPLPLYADVQLHIPMTHNNGRPGVAIANAPQAGIDGTDGEHPRFTTVSSCVGREIGLYEKQSSFFIMAKSSENVVRGNVFFNGQVIPLPLSLYLPLFVFLC